MPCLTKVPKGSAWVVTPGGAWCRSLYLCGALTEVTEVTDVLFCRLADPTGAFDLVTGGRRGAVAEHSRAIPVPSFVAVTGIAQLYKKNGSWAVSVRPEYVRVIDKATRNRWIVTAADMTLARIERLLACLMGIPAMPGRPALSGTTVSPGSSSAAWSR